MAPICQKCGHTGFQEVMIYCRKCRIACEHKYCLYKFPKKGEKVRWFCEDCKPTVFPPSSPEKQEGDAGSCKSYPERIQKLQNKNPDLKNNIFDPSQSQLESKEDENLKLSSSDLCENKKFNKQRKLSASNDCYLDQKAQNAPLKHLPLPSTTSDDFAMHEVSPPEIATHRNNSHQKIEVDRPEASIQNDPITARPIIDHVWRGCISFGNEVFIPFRANGSTQACQKVFDAAKCLPPILPMEKYLRRDLQQSIFRNGPPTDVNIGLYFLPDIYAKQEHVFGLIDDIITKDLMFVFLFNEIELLVFPSCILPKEHQKFNDQYYLWGAFRKKQLQDPVTSTDCHSEPNNKFKTNVQVKKTNIVNVTCTNGENQKPAFESKMEHVEDQADACANFFGSPMTEELKRILERINEQHTQNSDKNPPFKRRTIEQIRAKYREETNLSSLGSKCTEMRTAQETKSKFAQKKKESTLNQQDKENSNIRTRSKTHVQETEKKLPRSAHKTFASRSIDESKKRGRSRFEDRAYYLTSVPTKRQKALFESKNKVQNRDKTYANTSSRLSTETKQHIDGSKKRKFQKDDDYASSFYIEKQKHLDALRKEKQKNHGPTLVSSWTEEQRQETTKDQMGEECKSKCARKFGSLKENEDETKLTEKRNCLEGAVKQHAQAANESSASPVSSICNEEQKQRDAMVIFDDIEGLEEGEIL